MPDDGSPSAVPIFTGKNIRIVDGCASILENWSFTAARRVLDRLFPSGFEGLTLVDLGCLEGGMTLEFARLGFDALGIEVRESNYACCRYLLDHAGEMRGRLRFERDDAWNLEKYGRFDVVFCGGLLYHLDEPRRYLDILAAATRKVLILNTHFATESCSAAFPGLSEPTLNEGLRGRWYGEHNEQIGSRHLDSGLRWASWKNHRSFWPMRPDLLQALYDVGFPVLLEQYDFLEPKIREEMTNGLYGGKNRGIFLALR